jgi:hypothetical protein
MTNGVEYPGGKLSLMRPSRAPSSGSLWNELFPPRSIIMANARIDACPLHATPAVTAGTPMLEPPWSGLYADQ